MVGNGAASTGGLTTGAVPCPVKLARTRYSGVPGGASVNLVEPGVAPGLALSLAPRLVVRGGVREFEKQNKTKQIIIMIIIMIIS